LIFGIQPGYSLFSQSMSTEWTIHLEQNFLQCPVNRTIILACPISHISSLCHHDPPNLPSESIFYLLCQRSMASVFSVRRTPSQAGLARTWPPAITKGDFISQTVNDRVWPGQGFCVSSWPELRVTTEYEVCQAHPSIIWVIKCFVSVKDWPEFQRVITGVVNSQLRRSWLSVSSLMPSYQHIQI